MDRIDEIINMFEKANCPKEYQQCPLYDYNDCDNYCPFTEAADMLKEYKEMKDKNSNESEEKSLFDLLDEMKHQFGYYTADCIRYFQEISSLSNCNVCGVENCKYKPHPGLPIRINCPFYENKKSQVK